MPFGILHDKLVAHLDGDVDVRTKRELWQQLTRSQVGTWVSLLNEYVTALGRFFRTSTRPL